MPPPPRAAADLPDAPALVIVSAIADNGVIGKGGGLPWHLPRDLAHFRSVTWGHALIMGRQTWQEVGRPLPGRQNIVLSSTLAALPEGVELARSFDEALSRVEPGRVAMAIGGRRVYEAALPRASRLELTRIHAEVDGDTHFPALDLDGWRRAAAERHSADARHAYALTFETWERNAPVHPP